VVGETDGSKPSGGLQSTTMPPASTRMQIPAQTSHSQQPPSQKISIAPVATKARSRDALPRLLTPCTMPPLPFLPPTSPAKFQKEFTLRSRLPPGMSLRSLPHSTANVHPLGALRGIGGAGDCNGRDLCDLPPSVEMKAPRPRMAVKRCPDGTVEITPSGGYAAPKKWCVNHAHDWDAPNTKTYADAHCRK